METRDRQRVRTALVVAALAVVAGVAVFRIPLQSIFVLGIALVCPLLMVGMHAGGHRDGHDHGGADASPNGRNVVGRPTGHEGSER